MEPQGRDAEGLESFTDARVWRTTWKPGSSHSLPHPCFSVLTDGPFLLPSSHGGKWQFLEASEFASCSKEEPDRNFLVPIPNST